MRNTNNGPVFALLGLAIWAGPSAAAGNDAALRCAAIGDGQARLACYDGIFRAADAPAVTQASAASSGKSAAGGTAAPAGADVATTPAAAAGEVAAVSGAPASDPLADFGLTPAQQRAIDPVKAEKERAPDSISGTVARLGYKASGELVVTLENGQVWMQIDTGSKPRVKAGDTVTIKRGTLGSFLLVSPSGMATRVRRLK